MGCQRGEARPCACVHARTCMLHALYAHRDISMNEMKELPTGHFLPQHLQSFTGTRPTCHFSASSESSLDTYRIIAARLPFYNSRRIRENAERILIFPGKMPANGDRLASRKSTGDIRKCFMVIRRIHIPPSRPSEFLGTATSNGSFQRNILFSTLPITIGRTKVRLGTDSRRDLLIDPRNRFAESNVCRITRFLAGPR